MRVSSGRSSVVLPLVAVVALALAARLTPEARSADPPSGGTLVFGRGSDSITLDPPKAEDGESTAVIDNVFDGLVRYSDDGKSIEPDLAEKWERSADGKTWTFELAKGVKFHDGSDCDAEAVKFTFERLLDKKHKFHDVEFVNTNLYDAIEKIEAKTPTTVVFHLARPVAAFLGNLTVYTAKIVCPKALEKMGAKEYAQKPVGSGPFVFKVWERGQRIVLDANKTHFRGKPGVDRVILVAIKENAARLEQLRAGKIHVLDGLSPTSAAEIGATEEGPIVLCRQTGMNVGYLAFNTEKKPWTDPRVRRAVALALDPARIVQTNFQGYGTAARNLMPPFIFGWDESAPEPKPQIEAAKKLLAEAGVALPLKLELLHMSTPRPYFPEPKQAALVIQDSLKAIGVEATLVTLDWSQYIPKTRKGEFEVCLMGWTGDTSDPDNFLNVLCGKANLDGTNVARYADEGYAKLCLDGQSELDEGKRKALYVAAQKKLREDAPVVPLVHADGLAAIRKGVKGFLLHPTGRKTFKTVTLAK